MNTWNIILAVIGGGILGTAITIISNSGKTTLTDAAAELRYVQYHLQNRTIRGIKIELQFTNTSGYNKIIRNINASFFNGTDLIDLTFEGIAVSPADVIPSRNARTLGYELNVPPDGIEIPPLALMDDAVYIQVSYIKGKRKELRQIHNFTWKDGTKRIGVI